MHDSLIQTYLGRKSAAEIAPGFLAYLANLETVAMVSAEVARSIVQELADQRRNIKLIASENYSSLATQCAMANLLTDKYAEGIPHHRFYAGCDNVDSVEELANKRACELFGERTPMPSRTVERMPTWLHPGPFSDRASSCPPWPSSWQPKGLAPWLPRTGTG